MTPQLITRLRELRDKAVLWRLDSETWRADIEYGVELHRVLPQLLAVVEAAATLRASYSHCCSDFTDKEAALWQALDAAIGPHVEAEPCPCREVEV